MIRYDNENLIMMDVISLSKEDIHYVTGSNFEKELYQKILCDWGNWTVNNSSQSPPPDYFSNKHSIMFDVFRINDSEKKKGYNPLIDEERRIEKEFIKRMNIPSNKQIVSFIVADLNKPYDEIYTFVQYKNHANRVTKQHINKINKCKELHQGFKIGYLICDESDLYVERLFYIGDKKGKSPRLSLFKKVHFPFYDRNFMAQLIENDVDFVIWYTPYKFRTNKKLSFTKIHIIDLKEYNEDYYINYNEDMLYVL